MTDAMPDYGEPVKVENDPFDKPVVKDRSGREIAECYDDKEAARIVSCYNACRGIPDPEKVVPLLVEAVISYVAFRCSRSPYCSYQLTQSMDAAIAALQPKGE